MSFRTLIVSLLALTAFAAFVQAAPAPRDSRSPVTPTPKCPLSTPCGWEVYKPYTRHFDFFMYNTCECPSNTACTRAEDDLSVSAYVYRCKPQVASPASVINNVLSDQKL